MADNIILNVNLSDLDVLTVKDAQKLVGMTSYEKFSEYFGDIIYVVKGPTRTSQTKYVRKKDLLEKLETNLTPYKNKK